MQTGKQPEGEVDQQDEPALAPEIELFIGQGLRSHFDSLLQEPVPDKFLLLLAQLEAKEREGSRKP